MPRLRMSLNKLFAWNPAIEAETAYGSALDASARAAVASGVRVGKPVHQFRHGGSPHARIDRLIFKRTIDRHHTIHTGGPLFNERKSHQCTKAVTNKRDFANSHFFKETIEQLAC